MGPRSRPGSRATATSVAAVIVVALAQGCGTDGSESAVDCAAPTLTMSPSTKYEVQDPVTVEAGSSVTVYGFWYARGCKERATDPDPSLIPQVDLALVTADDKTVQLTSAHPAGDEFSFRVEVTIPADAVSGTAEIVDQQPYPEATLPLEITGPHGS